MTRLTHARPCRKLIQCELGRGRHGLGKLLTGDKSRSESML